MEQQSSVDDPKSDLRSFRSVGGQPEAFAAVILTATLMELTDDSDASIATACRAFSR